MPHVSFFTYCETMLDRYRDEKKVGQISGLNVLWGRARQNSDIYFSKYPMCWGWATWADRWQYWDRNLNTWPEKCDDDNFRSWLPFPQEWDYWEDVFDKLHSKNAPWDTWAFPWTYTNFAHQWLSVTPSRNLVTNVGFGADSTHTADDNPSLRPQARKLSPPYTFPEKMMSDPIADELTFRTMYKYEEARPLQRLINETRIRLGRIRRAVFCRGK